MGFAEDFARLADELRRGPNGLLSDISFFPSGAISMRVRMGIRSFDMDYFPSSRMFGVDELEHEAAFNSGYRFAFHDFASAKTKLLVLLEEALVAPAHEQ